MIQNHRVASLSTAAFVLAAGVVALSAALPVAENSAPKEPRIDRDLYPQAYGVLASERLMYPVDMSDWPVKITTERQLFVDDYLIATRSDLSRQLHQVKRHAGNPVLRLWENPWERGNSGALIVRRDENTGMFRMWYGMRMFIEAENGLTYRAPTCYATSKDGIHWHKPNLGIFKFGKDKNNNICLPQGAIEGLFYHPNDPDPDKRYKALVWHDPRGQDAYAPREGFYLYWSPDGLHWKGDNRRCVMPMGMGKEFPDKPCPGVGDSTNFQWDAKLKKYVANTKFYFKRVGRVGGRCESDEMIHWGRPRMVLFRNGFDDPDTQMYERTTFPYESMWIGPTRIMHGQKSVIPKPPISDVRPGWKQVAVELTASRDGRNWTRVCPGQHFIPLGGKGSWDVDYLNGPATPLLVDDELWFYYQGEIRWERFKATGQPDSRGSGGHCHIGLATLRRDGFVSLNGGDKPGTVVTRPLTFEPGTLYVNAEIADGGYLKAELRDAAGTVIQPYRLADCKPVTGDVMEAAVEWAGASALKRPQDQSLHLVFQLKNAKLYSFWIE